MRISLLLQREPLPTIVEQTLSSFWSLHHGTPYTVCWRGGYANSTNSSTPVQRWLVNAYLNTIAVRHASPAAFDPIRREFSRSRTWWKRPAQQLYVRLASTPNTAPLLAQATVEVSPAVPGATHKVIVAGNHKLRLLDHQEGRAYGILKAGFLPHFMQQELAVRQKASECGLPVPQLLEVAEDGTWFSEAYLSGTPVNRLPDQSQVAAAVQAVYHRLQTLHAATAKQTTIEQYATTLRREIGDLLHKMKRLTIDDCNRLNMLADGLLEQVYTIPQRIITIVLCHGDFQPANILLNADGPWLIDWEYATHRQAAYDLLVYALSSRFPKGIASRLQAFVHNGLPANVPFSAEQQRVLVSTSSRRHQQATLFLLEELHQHLCENSQPLFNRSGEGLRLLQTEISQWLQHVVQIGS